MAATRRLGRQEPTFEVVGEWHHSAGARLCLAHRKRGVTFYPSQEHQYELYLARDAEGRFAGRTICTSEPRQNGKSFAARKYATDMAASGRSVLYSAHNGSTVRKMFRLIREDVLGSRTLRSRLKPGEGIYKAYGTEGVYFANGGMVEFQTRTNSGARGGTYDVIVVDEAQELTYEQLEALKPTTIASESGDPQMIFIGTPPGPKCQGDVFRDYHDLAHSGDAGGIWWMEWAVDEVPDMSDRERVLELAYETNPAMGLRIREDVMLDAIDSFRARPESFAREYLGWWTPIKVANVAIDRVAWDACATDDPPADGKRCAGICFSRDGSRVAIANVVLPDGGIPHVEVSEHLATASHGVGRVADWIAERRDDVALFSIDGPQADALRDALVAMRVSKKRYEVATTRDAIAANAGLVSAVRERAMTHIGQPGVDEAAHTCTRRSIGGRGGFGFDGDGAELLGAIALAIRTVRTSKRDQRRKALIS